MRPVQTTLFTIVLVIVVGCMAQPVAVAVNPGVPPVDPAVKRQQDAIKAIVVRGGTVDLDGAQNIAPPAAPTDPRINPKTGLPMNGAKPAVATDTPIPLPTVYRPVVKVDVHGFHNVGAALATLEPLTKLRTLNIYDTRPTAADLQHFATFPELHTLDVISCKITDNQLAYFAGSKSLSELDLDQNPITDGGLVYVKDIINLRVLTLLDTRVTDQGLGYLRGLKSLEKLAIGGKGITDRGLEQLEVLTNLHELYLPRTGVSAAGIARLQTALPRLRIIK